MARFPTREAEVVALAGDIIHGIVEHAEDFPSPPMTAAELQALIEAYDTTHNAAVTAQGAAATAFDVKGEALQDLKEGMRAVLGYAEHAVKGDDKKLKWLGWNGRKEPTPLQVPGPARALEIKREGPGWIYLDWKIPANGGGVAVYRVYRRPKEEGGDWAEAALCFDSVTVLTDQPQGVELEYHVIAANKAGDSIPSNFVTAVL